ncbi:MAG: hypothetical protein EOP39_04645 [Rubrivivax sp.]|nr:MAG: hypothetical protein EOP39_04645 [Rubrivivax sp.]
MQLSRYRAALPIGSQMDLSVALPVASMGDGSEWLKTGILVAAASYPQAAALTQLQANTTTVSASGSAANGHSIATNGTGTYVAVDGSAIYVSTDGGATWATSTVTGGFGGGAFSARNPTAVTWSSTTGFVVVGLVSNGSAPYYLASATSATGASASWSTTAMAGSFPDGYATVGSVVQVAWSGTQLVCISSSSISPAVSQGVAVFTSPTGATWTAATAVAASTTAHGATLATSGNTIVVAKTGGTGFNVSTNGGTSWTDRGQSIFYSGAAGVQVLGIVGGVWVFRVGSEGSIWTMSNPASDTPARSFMADGALAALVVGHYTGNLILPLFSHNASRLGAISPADGLLYTTADGVNWASRGIDSVLGATRGQLAAGASDFCFAMGSSKARYAAVSPWGTAPSVGMVKASALSTSAGSANLYTRIK